MADKDQGKNPPAQPPQTVEREIPLDTKLLSDAVIELNISRKNVGIYPPGHIQIIRSIERAYEILQRLFEIRSEMTLGIAKDTLLVGQDYLDRKNPVYRDFALSLNQQGIAAVTFISGLGREELVRFHRILTTKPADIEAAGGVLQVMAGADIPHIAVKAIDYGSFHLTEEQEIARAQKRTSEQDSIGVWQDFVSHLSAGTLARPGQEQGVSVKDAAQIDPMELARLLNERKLDPNLALQSYDHVITSHVRAVAEKKELTREQSETLRSLNNLLKNLHPELRKQFLSVAFQRTSSYVPPKVSEEVLGGFTDDMVIEMLQQASAEGREISPTLTGLVQKLSRAGEGRQEAGPRTPASPSPEAAIPLEHMQKLFEREGYENYVSADYGEMLKGLTERPVMAAEPLPQEEYAGIFEDKHLDFQIGRALLAFMEENIDDEDYEEFAKKLVTIVPGLLDTGNFALLLDIVQTLFRHSREKMAARVRLVAEGAQKVFRAPEFMAKAVSAFDLSRTAGKEAADFLYALGPGVVPSLLDIYAHDESAGGRRMLFDLLCRFGQFSVLEAQKRLRDPRAYYVRNLVMLVRWAGTPASAPYLKSLLSHPDRKVRMEALTALLKFKDLGAVTVLREALRSEDPDELSQAVYLAGQHRITAVVIDLLARVKKVILFETDYIVNEEIIRALGEIGDPRAVPELEKLARMQLTLYPNSRDRMKTTLFESLERYPRESIADLLKLGERSDNDKIRLACRKLMERKG
jgi:hypothetical protein